MSKYLGLDASTQSLSALVIDIASSEICYSNQINFGQDLPQFQCPQGYLANENNLIRHSDPRMWVTALDTLFTKMKDDGFNFSEIECISGSGQQHGSVYLNKLFLQPITWDRSIPLAQTIKPMLSRKTSPIWMDSSTTTECSEITKSIGDATTVCTISGSIATERFTGPQIRKFYKEELEDYTSTAAIHLVSSFMNSILIGKSSPIDRGDASGMNLLNIRTGAWDQALADATAPNLMDKLPHVVNSDTVVGTISSYFIDTYDFSPQCKCTVWSGDNPNALVGLGANKSGTAVISLGTSDTFISAFEKPQTDPTGYGHAFMSPAQNYMSLICFKNGSLARELIKEEFNISWDQFNRYIQTTPPGNNGNVMVPFYSPEITPRTSKSHVKFYGDETYCSRSSSNYAVRAIAEAQLMNMKIHSKWASKELKKIRITGGASQCDGLCQIAADIFQVPVQRFETSNSAALGSALRAAHSNNAGTWQKLNAMIDTGETTLFSPNTETKETYKLLENRLIKILNDILGCSNE